MPALAALVLYNTFTDSDLWDPKIVPMQIFQIGPLGNQRSILPQFTPPSLVIIICVQKGKEYEPANIHPQSI